MSARASDTVTLQSGLETADDAPAGGDASSRDAAALLRRLHVSGRFHRDGRLGRVFHRGMVSLRENVATDSLHIAVDDNHLSAHVDAVSPLTADSDGPSRYSLRQAAMHNVHGMAQDALWLARGRQGDHTCRLDCEWISDGASRSPALLDPRDSSWSVQLEVRVAGTLDERRLRAALATVLGVAAQGSPLEVVTCDDDDALRAARTRLQSVAIGLTGRPPLRAQFVHHGAGDVLMMNLNAAAADGAGALDVLRAVARAYAGDADDEGALDFLACRDLPVRPAAPRASLASRLATRVANRLRDTLARPRHLAADGAAGDGGYGVHPLTLDADLTARIAKVQREHPERLVLMGALHLAIGRWNSAHDETARQINVLAPVDLRPDGWTDAGVGNFSVMTRLSTTRRERSDPPSVLWALAAQVARNKRQRTGTALIEGLRRNGLLTLWAKQSLVVLQPLTGHHNVDAAMLCDLGHVDLPPFGAEAGAIREVWFSTPSRSPECLSIGAAAVDDRVHLSLRYPHSLLDAAAAGRFADCYHDEIRRVAAQ